MRGGLDCEEMQVVVERIGRWRVSESVRRWAAAGLGLTLTHPAFPVLLFFQFFIILLLYRHHHFFLLLNTRGYHRLPSAHPPTHIPSTHWVISGSNVSPNLATRLPSFLTTSIANPPTPTGIRTPFTILHYHSLKLCPSSFSHTLPTVSPLSFTFMYSCNPPLTRPHAPHLYRAATMLYAARRETLTHLHDITESWFYSHGPRVSPWGPPR